MMAVNAVEGTEDLRLIPAKRVCYIVGQTIYVRSLTKRIYLPTVSLALDSRRTFSNGLAAIILQTYTIIYELRRLKRFTLLPPE